MKVMILGSIDKNYADEYERVCTKIATVLANRKDTLVICSLFEDSVDYYVFKEFINGRKSFFVKIVHSKSVENFFDEHFAE